jgi:hypothetical protein
MNPDRAIEMLTREHRTILWFTQGIGRLARLVRERRDLDLAQLREAVAFMRELCPRYGIPGPNAHWLEELAYPLVNFGDRAPVQIGIAAPSEKQPVTV